MIVEKTETGFSAYSDKHSIFTTGKNVPEITKNAFEAAQLYYEEYDIHLSHSDIEFTLDFQQFFKYYKVINAKFLAERIGLNPALLSQYVQGHKQPSKKQTDKILNGIHEIGEELAGINLF